jgi:hypothetical protein
MPLPYKKNRPTIPSFTRYLAATRSSLHHAASLQSSLFILTVLFTRTAFSSDFLLYFFHST